MSSKSLLIAWYAVQFLLLLGVFFVAMISRGMMQTVFTVGAVCLGAILIWALREEREDSADG